MRRFSTAMHVALLPFVRVCRARAVHPPAKDAAAKSAEQPASAGRAAAGDAAQGRFREGHPADLLAKLLSRATAPEKAEGGLRLDRKADAARGGDSGPAFVPGKSAESRLIGYVAGVNDDGTVMPPEGQRLSRERNRPIANLDRPGRALARRQPTRRQARHGPLVVPADQARRAAARCKRGDWVRNGIDAFVLAQLEELGLAPSPEADRPTLIRRLCVDLLGLPPSPAEVEEFVADTRPDAYERLVDRLLASPHYGERWGRHWLDLARYADSDGYEKDTPRPFAWRYRDWVIDALNRDLPFDQFTIEQLAGDLLPDADDRAARRDGLSSQHADEQGRGRRPGRVPRRGDRSTA